MTQFPTVAARCKVRDHQGGEARTSAGMPPPTDVIEVRAGQLHHPENFIVTQALRPSAPTSNEWRRAMAALARMAA